MTGAWAPRRFWTTAHVAAVGDGFEVHLDTRPVRTPGRAPLRLPTEAMATLIAAEWEAQDKKVDPATMPATRAANTAIDRVAPDLQPLADHLAEYGGSDLLAYRAEGPEGLVAAQAAAWDPPLAWADSALGARLRTTTGVMPVAQPAEARAALRRALDPFSAFELVALSDLVTLSGSLVLGLAVARGAMTPRAAWEAARVDETWQIATWGADEEAADVATRRAADFAAAARFLGLCR